MSDKQQQRQRGSLLLVALVLLGVIAFSTVYLSVVVNNEIKNTRYADNSIVSYYVAESGAERALWTLKSAKAQNATASFYALRPLIDQWGAEPGDTERTYDYSTTTLTSQNYTLYDLAVGVPVTADIYDRDLETVAGGSTGVDQINVDWYLTACNGSAQLEINYTPIAVTTLQPAASLTQIDVCNCSSGDGTGLYRCDLSAAHSATIDTDTDKFYRLSFRPLTTAVKKLVITANANAAGFIPSLVTVKTVGSYRESLTTVTTHALWKDALSGIFNYVVFSEESLIKDVPSQTSGALGSLCGFCDGGTTIACSSDNDCTASGGDFCNKTNALAFCSDTGGGEAYSDGSAVTQTNVGFCNAACNGLTYCGDGSAQTLNGSGTGFGNGTEQCDDGVLNSDTRSNACRTDCQVAHCGDGVTDLNEECDAGPANGSCPAAACSTLCTICPPE